MGTIQHKKMDTHTQVKSLIEYLIGLVGVFTAKTQLAFLINQWFSDPVLRENFKTIATILGILLTILYIIRTIIGIRRDLKND